MTRLPERSDALDHLLDIVLRVAVVAFAGQVTAHLVNEWLLGDRVANLDAGAEANATTWASSVATFSAALAAALLVVAGARARSELLGVVVLLAFFSLDDVIQAHERISAVGVLETFPEDVRTRLWLPVYLPLLAVAAILLVRAAADAPGRAARFIRSGVALLVVGVALEVVGLATKRLARDGPVAPDDVRVAVEESIELAAWILVAGGLVAAALVAWQRPELAGATPAGGAGRR